MKLQITPLYAVDDQGRFFQVVAWRENINTGIPWPLVVPLGRFGQPHTPMRGSQPAPLAYLTQAPDVTHELNQLGQPAPGEAQTEILQRVGEPLIPRAPGWHGR
jgi:hypothetical protein